MKITVIGTGYVGLVTGICFAEFGNEVICVDSEQTKIDVLNQLKSPIYEPGLDTLLENNFKAGRLQFTSDFEFAIKKTDICFICVGTPPGEDGDADLTDVKDVADSIGKYMIRNICVIDKSTVPVGTAKTVRKHIQKQLNKRGETTLRFDVVSNPEFLKEGTAISDCMRPDRIIIGADNSEIVEKLKILYKPFISSTENFILMDINSAEMTKYVANAMLATKISFMNEMACICEKVGADINMVRKGIGSDRRIGHHFIYAGCGYGGSCFPKDVRALTKTALHNDYAPRILLAVEAINNTQKMIIIEKIVKRFGNNLSGKKFAIWGLTFKPDTDDMRESPAITIIKELLNRGACVNVFDPKAMEIAKDKYFKGVDKITYSTSKYETLIGSEAMILVTEWKEFRSPDFYEIKKLLNNPIIFDGRNQYDCSTLIEMGFEYYQIGVSESL